MQHQRLLHKIHMTTLIVADLWMTLAYFQSAYIHWNMNKYQVKPLLQNGDLKQVPIFDFVFCRVFCVINQYFLRQVITHHKLQYKFQFIYIFAIIRLSFVFEGEIFSHCKFETIFTLPALRTSRPEFDLCVVFFIF